MSLISNYYITSDNFDISFKFSIIDVQNLNNSTTIISRIPNELIFEDKRSIPRLTVNDDNIKTNLRISLHSYTEISTEIIDISEKGIGLAVSKNVGHIFTQNDIYNLSLTNMKNSEEVKVECVVCNVGQIQDKDAYKTRLSLKFKDSINLYKIIN